MTNFLADRFLSCEDDEFVLIVDSDIRHYLNNSSRTNSILLFPAVNSYRRFLIHKVCESIKNEVNSELTTFSIGLEDKRRTVLCHKKQLLIDPKEAAKAVERSEENEFAWRYLKRNSVPKTSLSDRREKKQHRQVESNRIMGIENIDAAATVTTNSPKNNCNLSEELTNFENSASSLSDDQSSTKKNSRTRRPDRAFYIPRAKRSQSQTTSSLSNSNSTNSSHTKSHLKRSKTKLKSKSIDSPSSSNSEEANEEDEEGFSSPLPVINLSPSSHSNDCCDLSQNQLSSSEEPAETKSQKNYQNFIAMSQQAKELIIENGASDEAVVDKTDKDEKELIKASQEINRSNRKLIKQSFNSNVLEIEAAEGGSSEVKTNEAVNKEESDDWDTLFDDNGDCLDPKMMDELTKAVGKVTIEKPKSDYKSYHMNVDLLKNTEFSHVLECSNFPVEFRTQDLMALFAPYAKQTGFDIKWVDDTHCLVVFSSSKVAAEVLTASHPIVRLKPLSEATAESRTKARKCSSSLQPYRQRPETCAALAKRLVSGALGVRIKPTDEEREKEQRVLREAKERKLLAAKKNQEREDLWNN